MATVLAHLTPERQLELAVRVKTPARLAQTFAAHVGQFPDRSDFDSLARQTHELYAAQSDDHAYAFRTRLDRRLYDRYHEPIVWEVGSAAMDRAA